MKQLHAEWFPIDYPQTFFDRMSLNNFITIGCFYKIALPFEEASGTQESSNNEGQIERVMIGCIFSRVETENERN